MYELGSMGSDPVCRCDTREDIARVGLDDEGSGANTGGAGPLGSDSGIAGSLSNVSARV